MEFVDSCCISRRPTATHPIGILIKISMFPSSGTIIYGTTGEVLQNLSLFVIMLKNMYTYTDITD